jgi:hypothetical protein
MPIFISTPRKLESVSDNPLATLPSEDAGLNSDLFFESSVLETADVRIFALGVLPDHHHVYVASFLATERRRDAGVKDARPLAHVLVETSTYGQQKATESHVILNVRVTDRA